MKALLETELRTGEELVWCQQPHPSAAVWKALPGALFGLPFFSLPAFMLYNFGLEALQKTAWSVLFLLFSFLGFFLAIGAGMVLSPAWAYWKASRTVYAITDRRCITIAAPWRRTIRSFQMGQGAGDVIDLHRVEDKRGRGDLVFHWQAVPGKHGTHYHGEGFLGIQNVREAEDLVRELMTRSSVA